MKEQKRGTRDPRRKRQRSKPNSLQARICDWQVNFDGVLQQRTGSEPHSGGADTPGVNVPYRCLGAGLDGAQVGDLGLADDGFRDHTLNAEVHNLDRDKVLVGDVDEVLQDGEKKPL